MMYGHGNELSLYDSGIIADFSSNTASESVSQKLIKFLTKELHCISDYPEPEAHSLTKNLAAHHNISNQNVWITNGSNEAFYTIARIFHSRHSLIPVPSFSEYEDACKVNQHKITFCDDKNLQNNISDFDIVWVGNPNNPNGRNITIERIVELCKSFPNTHFIIDEAYADLCAGFESCISLTTNFKNLTVVRSLTKTFSIPGLRLGYVISNYSLIQKLKHYAIPWNVNALAIRTGNFIIQEYNSLLPDVKKILNNSFRLQTMLNELNFLEVIQSKCNFFLFRLLKGSSDELKKFLIKEKGILIRDASNFRGLDNSWVRIATQKTAYNNIFFESLNEWMYS